MPTNIRIIHSGDFVKTTPDGALDLEESKRILVDLAAQFPSGHEYHMLLDTRHAHSSLTVANLWYLATQLGKLGTSFRRKIAILCPLERFESAEFFALCSQNQGLNVVAFTSFEDAIMWLYDFAKGPGPANPSRNKETT